MKKLNKQQQLEVDAAIESCQQARGQLESAIQSFNDKLEEERGAVEERLGTYNEKLAELKGIYEAAGEEARNYYDERSERWQDSDVGIAYSEWADTLESPDELDDLEIDFPDPLEVELPDFSDTEWLPAPEPEEV